MSTILGMISRFFSKERIIGMVSALLMAIVAVFLGMSQASLKTAVCSGPAIELPKPGAGNPTTPRAPEATPDPAATPASFKPSAGGL